MKVHRDAKTNVYQRQLLVQRLRQAGWTERQATEAAGVTVRTVAKRLRRGAGPRGPVVSARRPPRRTSPTMEATIVAAPVDAFQEAA